MHAEHLEQVAETRPNVLPLLTGLRDISADLNRLDGEADLLLLNRIVEQAVITIKLFASLDCPPLVSAIIWGYDAASQTFNSSLRVAAGVALDKTDSFPRPDGFGALALRRGRRLLSREEPVRSFHPTLVARGVRQLVCYPLIANHEGVGVFYIYRGDTLDFKPDALLFLDTLANLATQALYATRHAAGQPLALEHQVGDLEKLRRAAQLINTRTSLTKVWDEILEMGLDMTAAQYGSFELYDKKQNQLTIKAMTGLQREELKALAPLPVNNDSIIGRVALHKKSLRIADLNNPRWRSLYHPLPSAPPMRSELAVPLIGSGDVLEGVLNLESPHFNAFSGRDQKQLETLAAEAVNILQEFRLLEAMQEIAKAALRAEEDELLQLIIAKACTLINLPVGSIWKIEGETLALRQSTAGYAWLEHIPLAESLTGQAIRLGKPLVVDDVKTHSHFHNRELATRQNWVSGIAVPLLPPGDAEKDKAIGGFTLYATQRRDFSDLDQKVLTYLANQATIAIQNAEEVADLKRSSKLSNRENEVLSLLIDGYTNKEIAEALVVSVNTVKKHVQSIFTKLNVDSRAAAVAKVLGRD